MERLTEKNWINMDPWECCGQDGTCTRPGGCNNGCTVPKLYDKLAQYEDMDEAKRLIKLPCKIGTTFYMIVTKRPKFSSPETFSFIKPSRLTWFNLARVLDDWGETCFATREEAEAALKELEKDNG